MEVDNQEVDRVCALIEAMVEEGEIPGFLYPAEDDIVQNLLHINGYPVADECKVAQIMKLAANLSLHNAVLQGLYAPFTQYLHYDVNEPTKFIGFNERVIAQGIIPFMEISRDMLVAAIHAVNS